MWQIFDQEVSDDTLGALRRGLGDWIRAHGVDERRHFDAQAKRFFHSSRNHMALLADLLGQSWVRDFAHERIDEPVLQHAHPLIKAPEGPATTFHQDRAFWHSWDNPASMFTIWVAVDEVTENNGCLRMADERHDVNEHVVHETVEGPGGTTLALSNQQEYEAGALSVPLRAGQAVFFDSFQIHGAGANVSDDNRLALKIVFADRRSLGSNVRSYSLDSLGKAGPFYRAKAGQALRTAKAAVRAQVRG